MHVALNRIKAGLANVVLKFISVEDKLTYMFLETFPRNVRPIVILPAVNTVMRYFVHKLDKKSIHGMVANGLLNGVEVSVIQTNMGSPSTALIMEALKCCGCKAAIRVDYCGGLKTTLEGDRTVETGLDIGNVVVPKTIFLTDGNSMQYLQENAPQLGNNPLFKDHDVSVAETWKYPNLNGKYWAADCPAPLYAILRKELGELNRRERPDIMWSSDSLFCESSDAMNTWRLHGCNSVDMESCAVYLLGALFNIPAISVLGVSDIVDVPGLNLMKVNKIHPGILKSLDDAYQIVTKCLPQVQQMMERHP